MALARAWKQMSWFYYQYLLVTALYMLEPWERTVFSILPGPRARGRVGARGPGPHPPGPRAWRARGGGRAERRPRGNCARGLASSRRARGAEVSGPRVALPRLGGGGRELLRSEVAGESLDRGRSVFIAGGDPLGRCLPGVPSPALRPCQPLIQSPVPVGGRDRVSGANRSRLGRF